MFAGDKKRLLLSNVLGLVHKCYCKTKAAWICGSYTIHKQNAKDLTFGVLCS